MTALVPHTFDGKRVTLIDLYFKIPFPTSIAEPSQTYTYINECGGTEKVRNKRERERSFRERGRFEREVVSREREREREIEIGNDCD